MDPTQLQQIVFPDKYHYCTRYVDRVWNPLELAEGLDNMMKLTLYSLRRQADDGPCRESAPYMWNVTERYKHQAWSMLGNMSKVEAMVHFTMTVEKIAGPDWLADQVRFEAAQQPAVGTGPTPADTPSTAAPQVPAVVASEAQHSPPPAAETQHPQHQRDPVAERAITNSFAAFDDVTLSAEVSRENVQRLVREVLRLRAILELNRIDYDSGVPVAASASTAADQPVPRGSTTSAATTAPAATPGQAATATPAPTKPKTSPTFTPPPERVYYSAAPRLGWLAWLGLASEPVATDLTADHTIRV